MTVHINKPIPKFSPMAIDVETTGLGVFEHKLLSIQVSNGTDTWILLDFYGFDSIIPILENENILKIAHNASFEYTWFKHHLKVDTKNLTDTFLTEKIIARDDTLPMGLGDLIARYCGKVISKDTRKTFEDHPGFASRPITNDQLQYMVLDVFYLIDIYTQQLQYVSDMELERTNKLEIDLIPAISNLHLGGVNLDIDLWVSQVAELLQLIEAADGTMRDHIRYNEGKDYIVYVPAKKKGEDIIKEIDIDNINFNSPAQLLALLKQWHDPDIESTNAATLETVVQKGDKRVSQFTELLLKRRGWKKRVGYDYVKYVNPITGKIHPSYHQLGARTGRFSCSKPNLQQVPRPIKGEPNMRRIWTADTEDYVIIRADYSQQEPRVMAELCGDVAMIEACNKQDVYVEFGKHIFGETIKKGSPERHLAKTFVLAVGYGAGPEELSRASGKPEDECATIRNTIRSTFPVMASYGHKMHRQAQQYGYVTTALGRRRYLSHPIFTIAVNTPVQGTAADMFKLALLKIYTRLTELKKCGTIDTNTRVWNLVHDEIEVHCHTKDVVVVSELVKTLMEEAGHEICPRVLHVAEVEYAYRWDK